MKKINRYMALLLVFLLLIGTSTTIAYAEETQLLTRDEIRKRTTIRTLTHN